VKEGTSTPKDGDGKKKAACRVFPGRGRGKRESRVFSKKKERGRELIFQGGEEGESFRLLAVLVGKKRKRVAFFAKRKKRKKQPEVPTTRTIGGKTGRKKDV